MTVASVLTWVIVPDEAIADVPEFSGAAVLGWRHWGTRSYQFSVKQEKQ